MYMHRRGAYLVTRRKEVCSSFRRAKRPGSVCPARRGGNGSTYMYYKCATRGDQATGNRRTVVSACMLSASPPMLPQRHTLCVTHNVSRRLVQAGYRYISIYVHMQLTTAVPELVDTAYTLCVAPMSGLERFAKSLLQRECGAPTVRACTFQQHRVVRLSIIFRIMFAGFSSRNHTRLLSDAGADTQSCGCWSPAFEGGHIQRHDRGASTGFYLVRTCWEEKTPQRAGYTACGVYQRRFCCGRKQFMPFVGRGRGSFRPSPTLLRRVPVENRNDLNPRWHRCCRS